MVMEIEATKVMVDGMFGIYAPAKFASDYPYWPMSEEQRAILRQGPEHSHYDETWEEVLLHSTYTDEKGEVWKLWQDGDIFAYTGDGEQWT